MLGQQDDSARLTRLAERALELTEVINASGFMPGAEPIKGQIEAQRKASAALGDTPVGGRRWILKNADQKTVDGFRALAVQAACRVRYDALIGKPHEATNRLLDGLSFAQNLSTCGDPELELLATTAEAALAQAADPLLGMANANDLQRIANAEMRANSESALYERIAGLCLRRGRVSDQRMTQAFRSELATQLGILFRSLKTKPESEWQKLFEDSWKPGQGGAGGGPAYALLWNQSSISAARQVLWAESLRQTSRRLLNLRAKAEMAIWKKQVPEQVLSRELGADPAAGKPYESAFGLPGVLICSSSGPWRTRACLKTLVKAVGAGVTAAKTEPR
jgi:hypothetical protein